MALSLFLNLIENSPPRKVEKNVAIENITASINSPTPRQIRNYFKIQNVIPIAAAVMSLSDEMLTAMSFHVVDSNGFETIYESEIRNIFSDLAENFNLNATKLQQLSENIIILSYHLVITWLTYSGF